MPKAWLQHSTFLSTAIEYGDEGSVPHIPVPFEKGVLDDLAAWCQLFDCALQPFRQFQMTDDEDSEVTAGSAAWQMFIERHQLRSWLTVVPGEPVAATMGVVEAAAVVVQGQPVMAQDAPVMVQASAAVAAGQGSGGQTTIRSLLDEGGAGCLEPLFRLVGAADLLECRSFLRVASAHLREYIAQLDAEQIRERFGAEPDIASLGMFDEWLSTLDLRTLRTAQAASPFWRAATQKLRPPPSPTRPVVRRRREHTTPFRAVAAGLKSLTVAGRAVAAGQTGGGAHPPSCCHPSPVQQAVAREQQAWPQWARQVLAQARQQQAVVT